MTLSSLEITLIIIATLLAAAIAYAAFNYKKIVAKAVRRAHSQYSNLLREAEDEITRLKAVNSDIKHKSAEPQPQDSTSSADTQMAQLIDTEKIALEQKKLEAQQEELAERNKMLWDMSVSIEKERQHIQSIKDKIEADHRAVTASITYAKLIQNAVLPSEEILKESFQDVFLFWRPRDIVSGDFYWMKRIGDTVIFTVADCTGHGVPGAFMSMLGVSFLNEICVDFNSSTHPAQILEEMRRKVISTLKQTNSPAEQKDGMDMALCILNLNTMKMQFAGANNGMYLVRGSELTEYKPVRCPIGIYLKLKPFENRDVDVQHGDYIYMFSDGYADQFSNDNQKYTSRRLKELIVSINEKTKSASEQASLLNTALELWRGDNEQLDDILIGGYQIR
ncbi:MAG: serine/threonine-protein phosphatase [Bacteroidales bacterium]|nr:serine/threonine-protein phosphatase [Bacteroidales bacterium]